MNNYFQQTEIIKLSQLRFIMDKIFQAFDGFKTHHIRQGDIKT